MLKALAIKELRESMAIVAVGVLAMLWLLGDLMGWRMIPGSGSGVRSIPFVDQAYNLGMMFIVGPFAIAMGLRQTAWENMGNSYYFLLHRPLARRTVFFMKMVVGLSLLLLLTVVPILIYASWAATPGNHASPFFWSMTENAWRICLPLPSVYLGAMLSGLRPARWYGSRLLPLIGVTFLAFLIGITLGVWLGIGLYLAMDAVLVVLILQLAEQRDY